MKKVILTTTAAILIALGSFGQNKELNQSYIFKSYEEYQQNKPSVILDHEKGDKIKYAFPAGLQTRLKIKTNNSVTICKPGDIWGYEKQGILYRQFADYKQKELGWEFKCYFRVVQQKDIVIYAVRHTEAGSYRGARNYTSYYYSLDLNSEIKKINDKNLQSDFKDKPELRNVLNEYRSR